MNLQHTIVLGSASPRRHELLQSLGLSITVRVASIDEVYPDDLSATEVPLYLAELKAKALMPTLQKGELLITSDTVVIQDGQVLGKPKNEEEARQTLSSLSNRSHEVVTGVFIGSLEKEIGFATTTKVYFNPLSKEEIDYYIANFKPFDKAGSYGIQEWIGKIGVSKIEGCFYNVMGLPVGRVWEALKQF